nr:GerAB/ArcD/ProY family transporter [Priestia abyssalis]
MENGKINALQMFCLIVLFALGTSIVVSYGAEAKRDAWLAILLGGFFGGTLIFMVYSSLYRLYPNLSLILYAQQIAGKWIGWLLGVAFIIYFIHGAARDLRDYGELLTASMFTETPLFIIHVMMILTMIYVLRLGIEVLGRVAELSFVIIFGLGITGIISVLLSNKVALNQLSPIMENGLKRVLSDSFPSLFVVPWGEMLTFTLILPYLNNPRSVMKVGLSAVLFSAVTLSFTIMLNISVLGADVFTRSNFALFETIRRVSLMEFIERLDPIVLLTLIIGDFFKVGIFFMPPSLEQRICLR